MGHLEPVLLTSMQSKGMRRWRRSRRGRAVDGISRLVRRAVRELLRARELSNGRHSSPLLSAARTGTYAATCARRLIGAAGSYMASLSRTAGKVHASLSMFGLCVRFVESCSSYTCPWVVLVVFGATSRERPISTPDLIDNPFCSYSCLSDDSFCI